MLLAWREAEGCESKGNGDAEKPSDAIKPYLIICFDFTAFIPTPQDFIQQYSTNHVQSEKVLGENFLHLIKFISTHLSHFSSNYAIHSCHL